MLVARHEWRHGNKKNQSRHGHGHLGQQAAFEPRQQARRWPRGGRPSGARGDVQIPTRLASVSGAENRAACAAASPLSACDHAIARPSRLQTRVAPPVRPTCLRPSCARRYGDAASRYNGTCLARVCRKTKSQQRAVVLRFDDLLRVQESIGESEPQRRSGEPAPDGRVPAVTSQSRHARLHTRSYEEEADEKKEAATAAPTNEPAVARRVLSHARRAAASAAAAPPPRAGLAHRRGSVTMPERPTNAAARMSWNGPFGRAVADGYVPSGSARRPLHGTPPFPLPSPLQSSRGVKPVCLERSKNRLLERSKNRLPREE